MSLKERIDAYYVARTAYEEAAKFASELAVERDRTEQKLIDAMLEQGLKSVQMANGTKPTLCKNVQISCTKDNFGVIRKWLVDTYGDDRDYVEETVNKWTVLAKVKKELDGGLDEKSFPPELKLSTRPGLRVIGISNLNPGE